jgi:hypothetical protein
MMLTRRCVLAGEICFRVYSLKSPSGDAIFLGIPNPRRFRAFLDNRPAFELVVCFQNGRPTCA